MPIPDEPTDEAAVQLLELLHALAQLIETHYAGQLHRYYAPHHHDQPELCNRPPC